MSIGPTITTARLILRPPAQEDFDGFAQMMADADHVRFIGGAAERAPAWRLWATLAGSWMLRGYGMFSMIERATGRWVGRVGPWYPEGWPAKEIGWGVAPWAAGQGFAHEAAVASMDYAFDTLGWDSVIHIIDPANLPSIALAKRLGSRDLGPTQMPAPIIAPDVRAWGQSAADWRARRTGR